MSNPKDLINALLEALQEESVLDRIAEKVAVKIGKTVAGTPEELWKTELAGAKLSIAAEVTMDKLAKLYPLTPEEIRQTVARLKTEKPGKPLAMEEIGAAVLRQLGDNVLISRLESKRAGVAKAGCGQPYECGYPHYCGHPVECGTWYEFWPCVSSAEHCAKQDYIDPIAFRRARAGVRGYGMAAACGGAHSCGQPYHCGPDFQCGAAYECGWRFEFWPCVSSEVHCAKHGYTER